MYRVKMQTGDPKAWDRSYHTFKSVELAKNYILELASRWAAVREWKIIEEDTGETVLHHIQGA